MVADPVTPSNRFAMRGYQADIDRKNVYTGQNYEEKGDLFLAARSQITHVVGTAIPWCWASLGDPEDLAVFIDNGDWNSYQPDYSRQRAGAYPERAYDSIVIDDDPAGRKFEGLIGVQVHVGGPMKSNTATSG